MFPIHRITTQLTREFIRQTMFDCFPARVFTSFMIDLFQLFNVSCVVFMCFENGHLKEKLREPGSKLKVSNVMCDTYRLHFVLNTVVF